MAVIGSVYASLYGSRLKSTLPGSLPGAFVREALASTGSALIASGHLLHGGQPALAATLHHAATAAFFRGFHAADYVCAGVAAAGALMALALLPAHPAARADDAVEGQLVGAAAAATR